MKIYQTPTSPNALRVRMVVHELGLEPEYINIDTAGGENRQPWFLEITPNGKIPVLVDGDFICWESRAITSYLGTVYDGGRLVPTDPKARAHMDQWSYWQAMQFGPAMHAVNRNTVQLPAMGKDGNAELAASKMEEVKKFFVVFEKGLEGKDFIVGDLSVADYAFASTFSMWREAKYDLSDLPNIKGWILRMEERPAFSTAREPLFEKMGLPIQLG